MNERQPSPRSDVGARSSHTVSFFALGTISLCLLTLATAVVQSIWDWNQISRALGFAPQSVPGDEPLLPKWLTLFTYVFPHGGWWHVLPNTIALWFFGTVVESKVGALKFVLAYFLSGAVGALGKILVPPTPEPIAGASLALSGIIGIYLALQWFTPPRSRWQASAVLLLEAASIISLVLWLLLRSVPAQPDLACSVAYHFIPFLVMWIAGHAICVRHHSVPSG